jgi:hypothetical protein
MIYDVMKRLLDFTPLGDADLARLMLDAAEEIERLRKAGDALAQGIRTGHWDDALDAWTELRGGQQ